jgi:photosystem II stability/assembly factor-like uncharacterized protein
MKIFRMTIITATVFIAAFVSAFILFNSKPFQEPLRSEQGDRDDPFGALRFRLEMVAGKNRIIDPSARMKAINFTNEKLQPSKLMKSNTGGISSWTHIGPGNIGGRIRGIVVSKNNPLNIMIGSVSGGVWKSTDGGTSWVPKLDNGVQLSVSCMVKDQTNDNIVYAGTGEGWGNIDAVYGGGIYKSTDFGETWNLLPSTISSSASWNFKNILELSFDPSNNLYAVTKAVNYKGGVGGYHTNGGLFKSTDAGTSWTKISTTSITNYYDGCNAIAFTSSTIIFATNGGGIFRTTDGGTNWALISGSLPTSKFGRIAFAKDPNNANTAFAVFESTVLATPTYGLAGIYKTTDAGVSWTLLTNPGTIASTSTLSYLGSQGWYDNVIAVDPFNSNNIYVGGVDMMKSTDGGSSWSQLTYWTSGYGTPVVHADHHAIVFHPIIPNVVFVGNDGGIYNSINGGASWTSLNNALEITQFYGGAVYPTGTTYFGGTQDNGHLKYGGGTGWGQVFGGDGGYAAQNQTNNQISYEEYVYLAMSKSTNGGFNWTSCVNGLTDANDANTSLFIAPFMMNPENSNVLIAGSDKVWVTINSTAKWFQASNVLADSNSVSAVTIVNASAPYLAFAGTTNGRLFICTGLSTSLGTWTEITPPNNNGAWVRRIVVDPTDKQKIYVCYSGYDNVNNGKHVWYSNDQGTTWNDISANLPDVPVHSLVVDNHAPSNLYIGTETGVYQTTNRGTTWAAANTGMPAYIPVDELVLQTGTNNLFAFTHGRGVFVTASPLSVQNISSNPSVPVEFNVSQNYPNPFNPATTINYSLPSDVNVILSVFNLKGELVKNVVNQFQKAGYHTAAIDGSGLASGIYFYRIDAGKFSQTKKMILLK